MTRNYGRFIADAIKSVVAQDMPEWEMIVSDDASTDGTEKLVAPFLADPRIQYIRHAEPLGQAGNWAFCLGFGSAPIVAVLHADDAYFPNALKLADDALCADEVGMFYGSCVRIRAIKDSMDAPVFGVRVGWSDKDTVVDGVRAFSHLIEFNRALPSATFLRRSILERAGSPDGMLSMTVDTEFLRRAALASKKVAWTSRPILLYREHENSTSANSLRDGRLVHDLEIFDRVTRHNLADVSHIASRDRPRVIRALRRSNTIQATAMLKLALGAMLKDSPSDCFDLLWKAFRITPRILLSPRNVIDVFLMLAGQRSLLRFLHRSRYRGAVAKEMQFNCAERDVVLCAMTKFFKL